VEARGIEQCPSHRQHGNRTHRALIGIARTHADDLAAMADRTKTRAAKAPSSIGTASHFGASSTSTG
jgi:hypothetical protein